MPIDGRAAVHDGDGRGGADRALAGVGGSIRDHKWCPYRGEEEGEGLVLGPHLAAMIGEEGFTETRQHRWQRHNDAVQQGTVVERILGGGWRRGSAWCFAGGREAEARP